MSTLLEKIQPEEFYESFVRLFNDDLQNRPDDVNGMYQDDKSWTQFMLHDLLPRVIEDVSRNKRYPEGRLECQHELMRVDLCAYDNVSAPYEGADVNQTCHGLPLYVHLMIEHENGQWPNQEFWKLLHLYARLKVLVCYLFPRGTSRAYQEIDNTMDWFKQMRDRVCAFYPRSVDDTYLLIIGLRGIENASEQNWQGYELKEGQQDFRQIQS